MGKPDAPEPTDPRETSAASTGTNVSTAIANNMLGNVSQYGPDGSTVFSKTGKEHEWTDQFTGATYSVPLMRQDVTLSPMQGKIKQQSDHAKLNLAGLARGQSNFLQDYMKKPFSYDTNDHEKWSMGLYDKLNSDDEAASRASLESQLANSGVKLGSDAYDRAMQNNDTSSTDARNRFMLDSYETGFGSAQAMRNQPINEITSLMSGSQVSQPQFMNANMSRIPTTDNAGIIANYDNQKMQQWQAEQAQRSQMMGGLFSLGSSMMGLSDKRAKKNIKKIGVQAITGDDGNAKKAGLFAWDYKGEKTAKTPRHVGYMAQEMQKKKPSAVHQTRSGLLAIDYAAV